ncbi:primosomal protein [Microbacterium sp.]|uniref:primosomal protein n=1 Tax=Microbacterium sp. TaxID=51671 RepID=UPI0039E31CAD
MPEEEERRPRRSDDRGPRAPRSSGDRPFRPREGGAPRREGGYSRDGGAPRREGGYSRDGGAPRRDGGYSRDGGAPRREGGYSRDGGAPRREGGYNRDGGAPRREGGYSRDGGAPRRDGGYSRDGAPRRDGGYSRDGGAPRRDGGYSRDGAPRRDGGYSRDGGAPRREGGYSRDGGAPRREGGYSRDGGAPRREGGYNRDGGAPRREGGYNREGAPRRDGDRERGGRSFPQRGGAGRERTVHSGADRPRHDDPVVPEEITARDLHPSARNELKTLSKENADRVARHLAMASRLIDEDPRLAHEHALAASRSAGRIAIVRETLGITAYAIEDFALALRELRTYRRISGKDDQIALMVDSERGIGRPDRALETGRAVDKSTLPTPVRVALAIAMSGARLDQGDLELALGELEIPELDPDRAFEWSPALFAARAAVLEDLGRTEEAAFWARRADIAAEALGVDEAGDEEIFVEDGLIEDFDDDLDADAEDDADSDSDEIAGDGSQADADELPSEDGGAAADVPASDDAAPAAGSPEPDEAPSSPEPSIEDEVRELLGEDEEDADASETGQGA